MSKYRKLFGTPYIRRYEGFSQGVLRTFGKDCGYHLHRSAFERGLLTSCQTVRLFTG